MKYYEKGEYIIGEFKVLDIFGGDGKSGMGVLYLVENRDIPTPIVLKTYQNDNENSIKRFLSEAQIWVDLGIHPNIVQAKFVTHINDQLYIGAEYINPDDNGRNTVLDFLKQGGVSNYLAFKWTAQFCYAMEYALSRGLKAHRDIKPANLMIDGTNLKVTDFGISKALYDFDKNCQAESFSPDLTGKGGIVGTLLYSSPEQFIDSSSVDFRSDIYSFGIILYQIMAMGKYPYSIKGKTTIEQFALMHLMEPVIKVNHPLYKIAIKCLERDPNNRYKSYKDILIDLQTVAKENNITLSDTVIIKDSKLKELYIQSLSQLNLGNKEKALELINRSLEINKDDSSSWSLKGRIMLEMEQYSEGILASKKSLKLDPYNSRNINNLGILYGLIGNKEMAIQYLIESVKIDKYNSGAFMNLAIAFQNNEEYDKACDCIKAALKLSPDKETLHFNASNIAAIATENKQFNKAIDVLKILIECTTNNENALFNLALNYLALNDKENAIFYFKKVEDIKPNDEGALTFLIRLNAELGRYDLAIGYCDKMIDQKINIAKAVGFKAQILQEIGEINNAIDLLYTALDEDRNNDMLWTILSDTYANIRQYKAALKIALKAKSILTSQENINSDNLHYLNSRIELYNSKLGIN